ncbi:MAG: protein-(glutamine-N5) methyltransferase, release factor-specific [Moraxellaceae bacterium]|jgi:release factor glutamine methyltransferase|nr:protein-(glutamine-N5) methyltransferase, release factor-specific [Moraxellaceae bacterium]
MSRIRELLRSAAERLEQTSPSPRVDADCLLQHVLQKDRAWLRSHDDAVLDDAQLAAFEAVLERRISGEPVAYITGQRGFWSLDLEVGPATLIPRPDTELVVEWALELIPTEAPWCVADLGTGSGAIALAVKKERPRCAVTAVDASPAALAMASANASRLRLEVSCVQGDWFAALGHGEFDLVLANPPYIAADDPHLVRGDLRFEPRSALVADEQGLADLRRIIEAAPSHVRKGGWLLLEHGYDQGEAVRALLTRQGFTEVVTRRDLGGLERASGGRLPC